MLYGYGILNNHVPTLRATLMKGGSTSPFLTSLYAVYKAVSNANDSIGTNNGTVAGGLTYTSGISGNSFTFNGTTSQIDFNANTMNLGDTFSVSFWVYMVNNTSAQTIISNYYELSTIKYGWFIYSSSGNFIFNRYIGTSAQFSVTTSAVSINAWNFITCTRKNGSTKIYVNGSLSNSDTQTNVTTYNVLCKPRIGSREQTGLWRLANGTKVDELNIWTKELTATEVTELYNAGTGKFYPTF